MEDIRVRVHDSAGHLDCVDLELRSGRAVIDPPNPTPLLLSIEGHDTELLLTGESGDPVYFQLMAGRVAARLEWTPCVQPERCESLRQSAGWVRGEPEVVLFFWRLIPAPGGGFRPDRVRAVAFAGQSPDPTMPRR